MSIGPTYSKSRSMTKTPKLATKRVVFVLGPPGCGKNTQCRMVAKAFGFMYVSADQLLRNELQSAGSQYKARIESYMTDGKVVPGDITCRLLERYLQSARKINFLIAGFPKNEENREAWNKATKHKVDVEFILCIECPEDVCMDRCLQRSSSTRNEDFLEILEKTITTFITETRPTIAYFESQRIIHFVNGNQSKEKVFEQIKKIFESYDIHPVGK